jgi:hypothetical protein
MPKAILPSGDYGGEVTYHFNDEVIATYRVFASINNV